MSSWLADRRYPFPINSHRWFRNGLYPDGRPLRRIADSLLHSCAFRRKIICEKVWRVNGLITTGASMDILNVATHTSPQVDAIAAVVNLAPATAGSDPQCKLTANEGLSGGPPTTDSNIIHYGHIQTGTPNPDDISWGNVMVCEDLEPDTDYELILTLTDYCRVMGVSIYEVWAETVDDTLAGGLDPRVGYDTPILDSRTEQYLKAATELWRNQGQHHLTFIADSPSSAPSITATSYTNICDLSSTTVSASTPGVKSKLVGHNSISDTSGTCVPVRMFVYAERTAGSGAGGSVRVYDGSSAGPEITGITGLGAAWYQTTGLLEASANKFDFQAKVDSGDTMAVYTVMVLEEDLR